MRRHPGPFGRAEAAHLLRRLALGATPEAVERAVARGLDATVDGLLARGDSEPALDAFDREVGGSGDPDLHAGVWLRRLATTARPLHERLVLFWHDHFVSALSKVDDGRLMQGQLALFRGRGTGSFRELARAVSEDPAMLRYLDGERSTRDAPNENFARELMELFTTGPGPYGERDVKEAARAFTGYQIRRGRFHFSEASHDDGTKTVLGSTGPLGGRDVVDLCVAHPATAAFLARHLARAFVADRPGARAVAALEDAWRRHDGGVGAVLRELATSRLFFAPEHRLAVTRSPALLVTAVGRALALPLAPVAAARAVRRMGQRLLDPPTVKGYEGGAAWLGPAAWIARQEFLLEAAARASEERVRELLATADAGPPEAALVDALVGVSASPEEVAALRRARAAGGDRALLGLVLGHPKLQRC